jgi:hypothetical protein
MRTNLISYPISNHLDFAHTSCRLSAARGGCDLLDVSTILLRQAKLGAYSGSKFGPCRRYGSGGSDCHGSDQSSRLHSFMPRCAEQPFALLGRGCVTGFSPFR